jgi:hypothetical protein
VDQVSAELPVHVRAPFRAAGDIEHAFSTTAVYGFKALPPNTDTSEAIG